jgi:IS5 family transposase
MKIAQNPSFADLAVGNRKIKSQFFAQINSIIDWRAISNLINKHYSRGTSATGQPSYDGLLLFKMGLLQTWYGLSDYEIEDRLNDSISFSKFCGLPLDKSAPDNSTLSRFRTELTQKKVYEKLFKAMNKQLEKHKIIVRKGILVDASITDSPLKPKGKTNYEIVKDREQEVVSEQEIAAVKLVKVNAPGVDTEAAWVVKAGKIRYGYKKHVVTDDEEGLVLGLLTTAANLNEITNLNDVLNTLEIAEGTPVKADKGYQSQKNKDILKEKKLKNHIMKKALKNKPLTVWEMKFNKLISKTRYKVERTFGGIKRWFNSGNARYRGLAKMHTQNLMEAIAYNLYRSPGIVMSNAKKD